MSHMFLTFYPPNKTHVKISGEDRIGKLPDEILGLIISHLTLRDAARTRLLSRRWRYVRPSHSNLNFDCPNMVWTPEYLQHWITSQKLCPCTGYQEKFVRGVNQFLESYNYEGEQTIQCFSVSCCVQSYADDVDGWVRSAVQMRAQTLSLAMHCPHMFSRAKPDKLLYKAHKGQYLFRSELLEGGHAHLRHLHLYACNLGPSFTNQFSSLESLCLTFACLAKYDLQSMFASLVKLKNLRFSKCTLPMELGLGPLLCLERFSLCVCRGVARIELSNANLSEFEYVAVEVISLIFKGVPNLWKFSCTPISQEQFRCTFTLLPEQLPMLRDFSIMATADWVNKIPESISTFTTVTRLRLFFFRKMKFDLLKMVSILKAFPLLRELHLRMCCRKDLGQEQLEHSGYVHEHLEEVEFRGFCTSNQIEFAIFILKHAAILKRLVIRKHKWYKPFCSKKCKVKHHWKEGERQKVCERLQEFSGNVMVKCLF